MNKMGNMFHRQEENIVYKGLNDFPDDFFVTGKKVRVINDENYVKSVQKNYGWKITMRQCLNQVFEVKCVDGDKGIKVRSKSNVDYLFHRAALEAVDEVGQPQRNTVNPLGPHQSLNPVVPTPPLQQQSWSLPDGRLQSFQGNSLSKIELSFKVDDDVQLSSDERRFIELQECFGGYSKVKMRPILGKVAKVVFISAKGVKVKWNGLDFDLHPDLLEKYRPQLKISSLPEEVTSRITIEHPQVASFPGPNTPAPVPDTNFSHPRQGISNLVESETRNDQVESETRNDQDQLQQLFKAIKGGDLETVLSLIKTEWLTAKDDHGRTPLNLACCHGRKEIVEYLLNLGDSMDICDEKGYLPVHNCLIFRHRDILEDLLEKVSDAVNSRAADGKTLLHLAFKTNQLNMIKPLKDANINELIKDNDGKIATDYARHPNIPITPSLPIIADNNDRGLSSPSLPMSPQLSLPALENATLRECEICMDRIKDTYFPSCGHTACGVCADRLIDCHCCKKRISKKVALKLQ